MSSSNQAPLPEERLVSPSGFVWAPVLRRGPLGINENIVMPQPLNEAKENTVGKYTTPPKDDGIDINENIVTPQPLTEDDGIDINENIVTPQPLNEDDGIDHSQVPALRSADGVILTNGMYRCNICGTELKNTRGLIRSHMAKSHPKDLNKPSAYMKWIERIPTPCGECDKICINKEALRGHMKAHHGRNMTQAQIWDWVKMLEESS